MTHASEPLRVAQRDERRRGGQAGLSPMTVLKQMPALVVLQRIPDPTLAIGQDGTILFANPAFARMLGYTVEELLSLKFHQVFRALTADGSAVAAVHAHAAQLVELAHTDGSTVRARMSKSALLRADDPVALATFQDLTEQLWSTDHNSAARPGGMA